MTDIQQVPGQIDIFDAIKEIDEESFAGHDGRECGEHRPCGGRAWCHDCGEWCYPKDPCSRCELPMLRRLLRPEPGTTVDVYVQVREGRSVMSRPVTDRIIVDYDDNGHPVGVEILAAKSVTSEGR